MNAKSQEAFEKWMVKMNCPLVGESIVIRAVGLEAHNFWIVWQAAQAEQFNEMESLRAQLESAEVSAEAQRWDYFEALADAQRWNYFIETCSDVSAFELTGNGTASNLEINQAIDEKIAASESEYIMPIVEAMEHNPHVSELIAECKKTAKPLKLSELIRAYYREDE